MKLLSIDIETTGLDPETCQILEVGCVLFDPTTTQGCQTWECLVKHKHITGDAYALAMNYKVLAELSGFGATKSTIDILPEYAVASELCKWLQKNGVNERISPAGKNFGSFDLRFLEKLPGWNEVPLKVRTLDVGALCFEPCDGGILDLAGCMAKTNVTGQVTHRALSDALDVANVVVKHFAIRNADKAPENVNTKHSIPLLQMLRFDKYTRQRLRKLFS